MGSKLVIVLIIAVLSSGVFADTVPGPKAEPAGNLKLIIVASSDPNYIKEWTSTPSSQAVTIKRLKRAIPNQLIVTAFLATGLTSDPTGEYRFSISYYFLDPHGEPLFGDRDYSKGIGLLPENPTLIMGDPALDIVIESSDPEGVYTIVAQIHDLVSGKKASDNYEIYFDKSES